MENKIMSRSKLISLIWLIRKGGFMLFVYLLRILILGFRILFRQRARWRLHRYKFELRICWSCWGRLVLMSVWRFGVALLSNMLVTLRNIRALHRISQLWLLMKVHIRPGSQLRIHRLWFSGLRLKVWLIFETFVHLTKTNFSRFRPVSLKCKYFAIRFDGQSFSWLSRNYQALRIRSLSWSWADWT